MKRTQLKSFFILLKLIYELLLNYTKLTIDDYERNNTFIARKCFLDKDKLEKEQIKNNNEHEEYENAKMI